MLLLLLLLLSPLISVTMSDRKAVIKNADMSEDMQQDAVDCATQAMEKYNIEKDIAAYIKKCMPGTCGGQKRLSEPLELVLQMVVNHYVGYLRSCQVDSFYDKVPKQKQLQERKGLFGAHNEVKAGTGIKGRYSPCEEYVGTSDPYV
ncbi:hypothetical protein STEG23_003631 [Scotinomys teguina]